MIHAIEFLICTLFAIVNNVFTIYLYVCVWEMNDNVQPNNVTRILCNFPFDCTPFIHANMCTSVYICNSSNCMNKPNENQLDNDIDVERCNGIKLEGDFKAKICFLHIVQSLPNNESDI